MSINPGATQLRPGKLWSLWDMLEIEAKPFVNAVSALTALRTLISEAALAERSGMDDIISIGIARRFRRELTIIENAAGAFQASVTQSEAQHFHKRLSKTTWREAELRINTVFRVFTTEVAGAKLFAMEKTAAANYGRAAQVFGDEAVTAFPKAEYDLEEAGKCLAVARNTACVFHLMRAMEKIVLAIGDRLKVTVIGKDNKELEWGKVIANIGGAIEAMPKGDERTKWHNAHSLLYHVKEAWRNTTMHPNQKYTDGEALEILSAVKAFVRSLAAMSPGDVFD